MNRKTERKIAGILRVAVVAIVVLLQLALLFLLVRYLRNYALYIYIAVQIVAILGIFVMVQRDRDSPYTTAWIFVIVLLPVFGLILYFLWGRSDVKGRGPEKIRAAIAEGEKCLPNGAEVLQSLKMQHPERKRVASYLYNAGFPIYQNTSCEYFPLGELQFTALKEDLKRAEKCIFMSTFILSEGRLWDEITEILIERASHGVDVRIMYDDFGSVTTVPEKLRVEMAKYNIKVANFNPVYRFVSRLYIHYRNHQKITVIDGNIAYTGGTNIADEYANYYRKHGHWKDTAIRLEGDGVYSLTTTFLEMWQAETGEKQDFQDFRPTTKGATDGFFQPYTDGPVNNPNNPAADMYRQMISTAKDYIYITTPYFVIDNSMMNILCIAAKSGVDVRLVVPKIWDHWYVRVVSRSNYQPLLEAGGRIYEYSPGFIHGKTVISDDEHAITGSINFDYRSFYLHFENGVWICGSQVIQKIKADIIRTIEDCEEIDLEEYKKRPLYVRAIETLLQVFAAVM